jgi:hypothetical protein
VGIVGYPSVREGIVGYPSVREGIVGYPSVRVRIVLVEVMGQRRHGKRNKGNT